MGSWTVEVWYEANGDEPRYRTYRDTTAVRAISAMLAMLRDEGAVLDDITYLSVGQDEGLGDVDTGRTTLEA